MEFARSPFVNGYPPLSVFPFKSKLRPSSLIEFSLKSNESNENYLSFKSLYIVKIDMFSNKFYARSSVFSSWNVSPLTIELDITYNLSLSNRFFLRLRCFKLVMAAMHGSTFLWYLRDIMFLCTPCKIRVSILFYCDIRKSLKTFALTEEFTLEISRCLIEFSVSVRFEKNLSKAS